VTTKPLEKSELKQKLYDPYKVLLHNDEHHDMDYVVESLRKAVPQLSEGQAIDITQETHKTGTGLVIVCPQEHAEMYCDNIKSFGLRSTIEAGG
jgi:ATP-dependent Clp protease adaptor protein ClpS